MKRLLFLACALVSLVSCKTTVQSKSQIINYKFEVVQIDSSANFYGEITGNTNDSALWIKSYSIEYKNNDMHVTIVKSLRNTGISDPYFIKFFIPQNVARVYLGNNELIWTRSN